MKHILLFLLTLPFCTSANANFNYKNENYEIDNKTKDEKLNIDMMSGKKEDRRFYLVKKEQVFNHNLETIFKSIINFNEKCNNDYSDRRKFLAKNIKCKYHNSNLVETVIYRNISKNFTVQPNESDRFIVARRIYNRQEFSHNELIKVYRYKEDGKNFIKITQQMLSDKQTKKYINPSVKTNSAFEKTYGEFILTAQADGTTKVSFTYSSETTHWLLNKSISVSKVFSNMAKSFDLLFDSIKAEAKLLNNQTSDQTSDQISNQTSNQSGKQS